MINFNVNIESGADSKTMRKKQENWWLCLSAAYPLLHMGDTFLYCDGWPFYLIDKSSSLDVL